MAKEKKTAYKLAKYVKTKVGKPYVYGAKQNYSWDKPYTKKQIRTLQRMYGTGMVWNSDINKAGKYPCDCSGLISAYTEIARSSSDMKATATKVWQIKSGHNTMYEKLKEVPVGACLWVSGHVGVFIGFQGKTPYYIAEDGSAFGCRKAKVVGSVFTHAILIKDVTYNVRKTYLATNKKKIKAYKNSTTPHKKRTFKKGKTFRIMAEYNGRGLLMKHSAKANLWVNLKDIKRKK